MAVTPNYSWPVPVNTDYVKDGAEAIKDLGDAIDATVFGLPAPTSGLTLIKTQVIGNAVTSVTVSGAFSATYDNYKIMISGGVGSAAIGINLKLGSTTTGYYSSVAAGNFANATINNYRNSNATSWVFLSGGTTATLPFDCNLINPFLAKNTLVDFMFIDQIAGGAGGHGAGYLDGIISYTDFTLTPSTGTITGGTISIYGYRK